MMLPLQIKYGEPSGASDMPNLDASLMVERMGEPGLPPIIGTYMRASQYVVNCFFFFTIDMDDHNFPLQAPVFESIVKLHPQAKVHKHIENQHVSTASHSKSPPLQPSTMYYLFVSEEDYIITNLATGRISLLIQLMQSSPHIIIQDLQSHLKTILCYLTLLSCAC